VSAFRRDKAALGFGLLASARWLLAVAISYLALAFASADPIPPADLLANLALQLGSARSSQNSWTVSFQLETVYAVSNSLLAQLQSTGDPALRDGLEAQLEQIKLGHIPPVQSETRNGIITVSEQAIRVESWLISTLPPPTQTMIISNNLEVITQESYVRRYSFLGGPTNTAFLGEAQMRSRGPKPLSLPPALIGSQISRFLSTLTNVTAELATGADRPSRLVVRGQDLSQECAGTCQIVFDMERQGFLDQISIPECDGGTTTIIIEPIEEPGLAWVSRRAMLSRRSSSGLEIYKEAWDFSDYSTDIPASSRSAKVTIPVDYLVNEYRFTNTFSYIMGGRPPTEDELRRMSRDRNAIIKYQRESRAPLPRARPLILALMFILCALPLLALKKSAWFRGKKPLKDRDPRLC
jgi:hypothetical protein